MKYMILLLLLTACATTTNSPPSAPQAPDTCGATARAALIGQDATALERVLIMGQVRVIRPGDVVTQDFRPERINFMIADNNVIDDITCG